MQYAKAFTFFVDDPRWQTKILIAAGVVFVSFALSIMLVGLLGFAILAGYAIRLMQNVRDGNTTPLPEWDDWGGDLVRGLKYAVIAIVWALPIILFLILYLGTIILMAGIGSQFNDATPLLMMPIMYCFIGLMVVYSVVIAVFSPGYTVAFAENERISSGFQFGDIWRWTRANLGPVMIVVFIVIGAGSIIQQVAAFGGLILCFVGLFVTIPIATVAYSFFSFHLYGQLAREYPFAFGRLEHVSAPAAATIPASIEQGGEEPIGSDEETSDIEPKT